MLMSKFLYCDLCDSDLFGINGYQCRYHVGRHVANLQVTNTYEGTHVRVNLQ